MRSFKSSFVQTCVTSPPYFGLRDYGVVGQIGLEPTPQEYVAEMVSVFREVRRVLRDDGTLWLNLGDSYAGGGGGNYGQGKNSVSQGGQQVTNVRNRSAWLSSAGLKSKDLIMIPAQVALALRADGWYLRSDIIWAKPNPMPESIKDRPTSAHEHVFLLSKSERYFYDADAIKEPATNGEKFHGSYDKRPGAQKERNGRADVENITETRNVRNVWTIKPKPFRGAHFATMPPYLVERCVKAGSAVGDIVLDPFSGAGTTAIVANQLGRHAVGIELNPEYVEMSKLRMAELREVAG